METEVCNSLEEAIEDYKQYQGVWPYVKTIYFDKEINIENMLLEQEIEEKRREEAHENCFGCSTCASTLN